MKNGIGIFILLLLVGNLWAQEQRIVIDKVVGKVGGELVLLSEVEEQYALMKSQQGNVPPDARCQIIDNLLGSKLLLNQSKLDSVEVSDEEVETQLDARIERILGFMNGDVKQFEEYYGQSVSEVKEQFREDLRNQLLTDRMRGQIISSVKVTPSEVKSFFASIPRDSLPYFNSEVEIGEIVIKPEVNEGEKAKAIAKLQEIRQSIIDGNATFEAMAQKFSDDGSARIGGDLGMTRRGKFVPEFEAAAYKLEANEISDVVETEFGFHLLQMIERRGNAIHVRHILIRPEITQADLELAQTKLDSVRNLLLKDSLNFSVAVKRFSNDKVQSYNNDGRMTNPATGNTFFEIGDLDPDIYFAVDTLKVGEVTRPIEFRDPGGDVYYRIVKLQSRTAPHRANLQQDYSKIQQAAIESKKNEFINEWVQQRVESTFIEIDRMFSGCPQVSKWAKPEGIARPKP